jgi:sulfoxide reductase heme-binding subunit YedZ
VAGVTYRGFHPRTTLVRWAFPAIAVGIIAGGTIPAAVQGLAAAADANPSSLPWLFERLFGFMAYGAVVLSVVYGLLLSTKILDAVAHRPVSFTLHQDLAAIGLGLAGIHGVLLGLDSAVPFTFAQILVPGQSPHAPFAVGVGQVALYLMTIVTLSFYARRRIGQRTWRTLHYVTFLAYAGSTFHGIAAGSDSGSAWAQGMYLASATVVVFLLTYRIGMSLAARSEGARPGQATRSTPLTSRPGLRDRGLADPA